MNVVLDRLMMVLFLAVLVFTALAHGAVEPWSQALSGLGIVGLLFLWGCKAVAERTWTIRIPAPFWPLLALLGWGLVQCYQWGDDASKPLTISFDAEATQSVVLWLGLLLIAFLVAANLFTKRERLHLLQPFATYFGLALALFALVQQATWSGRFYWLRTINTDVITAPFGPFVHHGHYAGYLELLLPFPMAMLLTQRLELEKKLLYGFAAAIMGVSVIASLARGGMLTLTAQLLFLALAGYWTAQRRATERAAKDPEPRTPFRTSLLRVSGVVVMSVAILAGVLWIGAEPVIHRVAQEPTNGATSVAENFHQNRGWIWRDTWAMFRSYPIAGVGLGAFETAFPIFSQADGGVTMNAAHNDYLQILAEGGLIGGACLLWFLVIVLRLLARALQTRDTQAQALALGAGTGVIGMLVHSIVDFNLQVPSHALLFLTLVVVVARLAVNAAEQRATAPALQAPPHYFDLAERWPQKGVL